MKATLCVALVATLTTTALGQEVPSQHRDTFFTPTRIALFSADFLVRTLDAQSTMGNLSNPCHCYKEDVIPAITGTKAGMYAYSLAVPAGVMGASYIAHRMHHNKIATIIPMIDIVVEAPAVSTNYRIAGRK